MPSSLFEGIRSIIAGNAMITLFEHWDHLGNFLFVWYNSSQWREVIYMLAEVQLVRAGAAILVKPGAMLSGPNSTQKLINIVHHLTNKK
jgi:hypothetical protein